MHRDRGGIYRRPHAYLHPFSPSTTPKDLSMKSKFTLSQRWILIAVVMTVATLGMEPAMAQALAPVVRASTIVRDTVTGVCLLLLTSAWGMAGYKVAFAGANFRDVSANIIGGAIAGGAATMAALFIA